MLALAGQGARGGAATYVFDEIDAGIGGNTAKAVGERLRALGEERQVLCITHLPAGRLDGREPLPDREERRRRPGDGDASSGSTARAWSPRSFGCWAGATATRRPTATPGSCSRPPRAVRTGIGSGDGDRHRPPAIRGTARLGRRTKELVKRLGPGDIAVIDHRNLDRIAAEELVASGVRADAQRLALVRRHLPEHRAAAAGPSRGPADRRRSRAVRP